MIFDHVQPSCGIWLIFCVSQEEEYREYTSSTLNLATDSRKMCLAPRKYIFVKPPEKEKNPLRESVTPDTVTPQHAVTEDTEATKASVTDSKDAKRPNPSFEQSEIAARLEQCSEMLESRFESMYARFQRYANTVVHARADGVSSRHVNTLHSIIERAPFSPHRERRFSDNEDKRRRFSEGEGYYGYRRNDEREYGRRRFSDGYVHHDTEWSKQPYYDNTYERECRRNLYDDRDQWEPDAEDEVDTDDVIRDLRRRLSEEKMERQAATTLLANAQEVLETVVAENVELERDFMCAIRSATTFLNSVEADNASLKQSLIELSEQERSALTTMAQKNAALEAQQQQQAEQMQTQQTVVTRLAPAHSSSSLPPHAAYSDSSHTRLTTPGSAMSSPSRSGTHSRVPSWNAPTGYVPPLELQAAMQALARKTEHAQNVAQGTTVDGDVQPDHGFTRHEHEREVGQAKQNWRGQQRLATDGRVPSRRRAEEPSGLRARVRGGSLGRWKPREPRGDGVSREAENTCEDIRARYMSVSANLKRLQRKAMSAVEP